MKIAHVSTFPETKCGIAFFVSDVIAASPDDEHRKYALHYGERPTGEFAGEANVDDRTELRRLGRSISQSGCDVVSLQHEFGIWGGDHGMNILPFLEELALPVVSTFHTTFAKSTQPLIRTVLLRALATRSAVNFVMSPRSKRTLITLLDGIEADVRTIPHGVPDRPFVPPRRTAGPDKSEMHLVSFGFLSPAKGLDVVLEALRMLRDEGRRCRYTIAGSPHPRVPEQEDYFRRIEKSIAEQDLSDDVVVVGRFLQRAEQIALIRSADAAMFAYQHADQSSSGTVALALAIGRPVVCTPFEFALALKQEIAGVRIARDFGAAALAESLREVLAERPNSTALARSVYDATRAWTWPRVAQTYSAAFAETIARQPATRCG